MAGAGKTVVTAARALVGSGQSHVRHPAEIRVIHGAQNSGWHARDHRTVLQVQAEEDIDGGGVGSQEERAGVEEVLGDADALVRLDAGFFEAATQGIHGRRRHAGEEGVDAPAEIDLVIGELNGRGIRGAVLEAQGSDAGMDRVGGRDLGGHIRREFRSGAGDRCGVVLGCAAVEKGHGEGAGDGFARELTFYHGFVVGVVARTPRQDGE